MLFFLIVILFYHHVTDAQTPCAMSSIGGANSLRVMSYNIRYDKAADGINRWSVRKQNVFNLIRTRAPDIFGLQEALRGQISDLKYNLPHYNYYGVGDRDGKTSGEFVPIFYRSDRFDLLDNGTFWLSNTPTKPGSEGWDGADTRICSWVKLRDRQTYEIFYHFNTHFASKGRIARLESARLILIQIMLITGYSIPIILTGDLNASPYSDVYHTITTNTPLKDSKILSQRSHCGPDRTFSTFFVDYGMVKCIDHIFITSQYFNILQHGTLNDSNNGFYPSDHLPVLTEITFKK
ncbi:unnamed protein product [Adineta steineri]|uniref:Endonuclease/exonuclease/phosphatase domain-containing protein n=1 Tax=Adineta steineri TaxID=433720 RepID=A0A814QQX4_9BILA|nr:unnamed protein product [Adineta steineri]CAF1123882.1 unnamed protein product [Adineta steineri]